MSHSFILAPFIAAFLVFILRFYGRENAASMASPSFLLAALTVLIAGAYLLLGVMNVTPPYGELAFGAAGLVLLATAVARLFMI